MTKGDVPAWMLCEDLITRMKDELVLEAIDILHEEMKANRIDISGYVSLLPDKPNEMQRDMYIINNLVQRQPEIMEQYRPFLESGAKETDPQKVERIEELKKFMLSVQAISTLMRLSSVASMWADDTGKYSALGDQAQIIARTASMAEDRLEVLDFVLTSPRFAKSEALTSAETEILKKARKALE